MNHFDVNLSDWIRIALSLLPYIQYVILHPCGADDLKTPQALYLEFCFNAAISFDAIQFCSITENDSSFLSLIVFFSFFLELDTMMLVS